MENPEFALGFFFSLRNVFILGFPGSSSKAWFEEFRLVITQPVEEEVPVFAAQMNLTLLCSSSEAKVSITNELYEPI